MTLDKDALYAVERRRRGRMIPAKVNVPENFRDEPDEGLQPQPCSSTILVQVGILHHIICPMTSLGLHFESFFRFSTSRSGNSLLPV